MTPSLSVSLFVCVCTHVHTICTVEGISLFLVIPSRLTGLEAAYFNTKTWCLGMACGDSWLRVRWSCSSRCEKTLLNKHVINIRQILGSESLASTTMWKHCSHPFTHIFHNVSNRQRASCNFKEPLYDSKNMFARMTGLL